MTALNPSSENPVRQESEDDYFVFGIFWFLVGVLNPVVLLVVLVTVAAGQKKLRGLWLINFGSLAGIAAVMFFNAVDLYFTPIQEIGQLIEENDVVHKGAGVVDLVLSHAGTWFFAQIPLGVPTGLIIAGVIIIWRRHIRRNDETRCAHPSSVLT